MGTRSLTRVFDRNDREIICMYVQFDGYFEGMGDALADFLKERSLCNGISNQTSKTHANGMECLAAQIVDHFKTMIGGTYLYHPGANDVGEEFVYEVRCDDDDNIVMTARGCYSETVIECDPKDFEARVKELMDDGDEDDE
jgi:hypothetical protein